MLESSNSRMSKNYDRASLKKLEVSPPPPPEKNPNHNYNNTLDSAVQMTPPKRVSSNH